MDDERGTIMLKQYRLKDGSIYWHKLYYAIMPNLLRKYSPPCGDYNYAYYIGHPHQYVIDLYYQAKWFVQRGSRGYADCDVWSLDGYLCSWMPEALATLRKNKMGYPSRLTNKGWDAKLDRMIRAFTIAREIMDMEYETKEEMAAMMKQFRKDFNVFRNHFFSLWD